MKTYHYIVKGRVQGVAFRYYTVRAAQEHSVCGTVRNSPDGDVIVYARGEPDNITSFELFLHNGPSAARVFQVIKQEVADNPDYKDFTVTY